MMTRMTLLIDRSNSDCMGTGTVYKVFKHRRRAVQEFLKIEDNCEIHDVECIDDEAAP